MGILHVSFPVQIMDHVTSCIISSSKGIADNGQTQQHQAAWSVATANCYLLAVPFCIKLSFASRAFCVSSPNNWNSLPAHIRSSDSLVNPVLNLTFSLLPITSSHPHASASDSTFDFWRYINIWLTLHHSHLLTGTGPHTSLGPPTMRTSASGSTQIRSLSQTRGLP